MGLSFNECFSLFDFSRTAEWWSIVGDTEEERAREGQKIVTKFRLKIPLEHTYENCHNITCRRKCKKDGYNKAINDFINDINHIGYVPVCVDCFTKHQLIEIAEQLKRE